MAQSPHVGREDARESIDTGREDLLRGVRYKQWLFSADDGTTEVSFEAFEPDDAGSGREVSVMLADDGGLGRVALLAHAVNAKRGHAVLGRERYHEMQASHERVPELVCDAIGHVCHATLHHQNGLNKRQMRLVASMLALHARYE